MLKGLYILNICPEIDFTAVVFIVVTNGLCCCCCCCFDCYLYCCKITVPKSYSQIILHTDTLSLFTNFLFYVLPQNTNDDHSQHKCLYVSLYSVTIFLRIHFTCDTMFNLCFLSSLNHLTVLTDSWNFSIFFPTFTSTLGPFYLTECLICNLNFHPYPVSS